MGRRSRKRALDDGARKGARRAERDAHRSERARQGLAKSEPAAQQRRDRRSLDDRPPPLWGAFPLTELITLAGIVLMVWGFIEGAGREGNAKLAAGLAIASVAGLELAVREHVTGFRSHTVLLSAGVAVLTIVALGLGAGLETLGILLMAGLASFGGSFVALRELFKRRSGGLSFR